MSLNIRYSIRSVIIILLLIAFIGTVSAETWYVDNNEGSDFIKIQDAIDNATAGDTIIVRDGTYNENVDVNKSLTIRSENGADETTVIASNPDDHVFDVTADYVNIIGLAVKGATEYGEAYGNAGVYLNGVNDCIVSYINASDNVLGIHLYSSSNNTLTGNNASNNIIGIWLGHSSNNRLISNTASSNYLGIHLTYSSNNEIINNTANSNDNYGIELHHSGSNTIVNNNVKHNDKFGIYLEWRSYNNKLTNNEGAVHNEWSTIGIWAALILVFLFVITFIGVRYYISKGRETEEELGDEAKILE
ncbi:MAG: NosD domain-containing protein [Halobacteriota archaeon]|nr:NosD domain-containing protein [Halobacteriota archaeon]